MKRIIQVALIALFFTVPGMAVAAGSSTCVASEAEFPTVTLYTYTFTADAAAATVPDAVCADSDGNQVVHGYLVLAATNPGTTAPTDNYDITVEDSDGIDKFGGVLTNRDTANSEQDIPATGATRVDDVLTVKLSGNSVNSATGVMKFWVQK